MQISQIPKMSFLFSIILGVNLLSYTVQPYVPPSDKHSLSYTVESCPSHTNRDPISELVLFFTKSEKYDASQKHCFCYTCNCERFSFLFIKSSVNLSIDDYLTYVLPLQINPCLKDLTSCIAIRSPPIVVS
jgi:hypothetical protein